tara:strand:- start:91 stop:1359 length:1269 start_codon:yes stop_codon:yes gene_type:complete
MKPVILVPIALWILTLGVAFLIGRGSNSSQSERKTALDESRSSSLKRSSSRPAYGIKGVRNSETNLLPTAQTSRIIKNRTPEQAVTELAKLVDPIERARGFLELLETLEADQFLNVVTEFRALGITEQRMSEYGMLLHGWAKTDPKGALAYTLKNTGTPFARQEIMASWSTDDPEAAIAFARANHTGTGANPLLVGVIRGIAPGNLSRATDLLQDLPYGRERGDTLQSILPLVMENGVSNALTWTASIADAQLQSGAINYIMSGLAGSEPRHAAELLVTLDDKSAAARAADDVGGALARLDLEEAKTWSAGLNDELRSQAIEGVIGHYASQDPSAASEWLASLPETADLDGAIRQFAWRSQRSEPQLAADWIGQIQSIERRNEMYNSVLSRWLRNDPASAEQWIQTTPNLPENVRGLPNRVR